MVLMLIEFFWMFEFFFFFQRFFLWSDAAKRGEHKQGNHRCENCRACLLFGRGRLVRRCRVELENCHTSNDVAHVVCCLIFSFFAAIAKRILRISMSENSESVGGKIGIFPLSIRVQHR